MSQERIIGINNDNYKVNYYFFICLCELNFIELFTVSADENQQVNLHIKFLKYTQSGHYLSIIYYGFKLKFVRRA